MTMGMTKSEPVFAHLEIDGYEPSYMKLNKDTMHHEVVRASPPGLNPKFFISHRGIPKLSKTYQTVYVDSPIIKEI